jgi:hypothetical protein
MSRLLQPLKHAFAGALLVLVIGVPLMLAGMLLWSLNALLGLATWYEVGYQLGYHGTWLISFTLAAGCAGLVWGLVEIFTGFRLSRK